MINSLTVEFLSFNLIDKSRQQLSFYFQDFLKIPPSPEEFFKTLVKRGVKFNETLLIDADWFKNESCLIVYRDYPEEKTIFYRYSLGEYKEIIFNDISFLVKNGYPLKGVVSDWKGSIVTAVRVISFKYFAGKLPHQRCLVHTQLRCQTLLTQRPKTEAGKSLLDLVYCLNSVSSFYEEKILFSWLKRFKERFLPVIKERTYSLDKKSWWYTHKYLRRAYLTLKNNWENLFLYLSFPFLSKDTNGLEGLFSQLDCSLGRHRGLAKKNRGNFLYWFFFLKSFLT